VSRVELRALRLMAYFTHTGMAIDAKLKATSLVDPAFTLAKALAAEAPYRVALRRVALYLGEEPPSSATNALVALNGSVVGLLSAGRSCTLRSFSMYNAGVERRVVFHRQRSGPHQHQVGTSCSLAAVCGCCGSCRCCRAWAWASCGGSTPNGGSCTY
jgi:hypothetical protein